jgi:N-acylglucosamine-6-phosphate 2-epimerase
VTALDRLRGGLIVSVQPEPGSVLGMLETIVLLCRLAERNGAAGVRVEGVERVRAVREAVAIPIVGITKCVHAGFAPYITSTVAEVRAVAAAGADVVAFDATQRPRADASIVADLVEAARAGGRLGMGDCSTAEDARAAAAAGCDLVATTLAGYTDETRGRPLPALDVVEALRGAHPFVVCEGGVATPGAARAAIGAGASAVVVGSAITNVDALVRAFARALSDDAT